MSDTSGPHLDSSKSMNAEAQMNMLHARTQVDDSMNRGFSKMVSEDQDCTFSQGSNSMRTKESRPASNLKNSRTTTLAKKKTLNKK